MRVSGNTHAFRLFAFFMYGALFGVIGDSGHVYTNVLKYPQPFWFGMLAWHIPFLFASGFVLIYLIFPFIHWHLTHHVSSSSSASSAKKEKKELHHHLEDLRLPSWGACYLGMLMTLLVYVASSVLVHHGWPDSTVSVMLWALATAQIIFTTVMLNDWYYDIAMIILSLVVGISGVVFEGSFCSLEFFEYIQPDVWFVRHWIVWLWMSAASAGGTMALKIYQHDHRVAAENAANAQETKKIK